MKTKLSLVEKVALEEIRKLIAEAKATAKAVKRMRKFGASDREIAKALNIDEEDIHLI